MPKRKRPPPPDQLIGDPPPLIVPLPLVEIETAPPPPPEPRGLECRDCGCRDLRVIATRKMKGGKIQRTRVCRHCGREKLTYEIEAFAAETARRAISSTFADMPPV